MKNRKIKWSRANNHQPARVALRLPTYSPLAQSCKYSGSPAPCERLLVTNGSEEQRYFHAHVPFQAVESRTPAPQATIQPRLISSTGMFPVGWGPGFCLHPCNRGHLLLLDFFIHLQKPATQSMRCSRQFQIWLQDAAWTHRGHPHPSVTFCSGNKSDFGKLNSPAATLLPPIFERLEGLSLSTLKASSLINQNQWQQHFPTNVSEPVLKFRSLRTTHFSSQ